MKKFIILILAFFAFAVNFAVATNQTEPPNKSAKETVRKFDLVTHFVGFPTPEKVTEPHGITAKFQALRLNLFLWKERLRTQKHENYSHNKAKYLRFNRDKEVDIWDFTEDLKRKATANKTIFETPDFMWSDSKLSLCNRDFANYNESTGFLKQPHYMWQNSKIAVKN